MFAITPYWTRATCLCDLCIVERYFHAICRRTWTQASSIQGHALPLHIKESVTLEIPLSALEAPFPYKVADGLFSYCWYCVILVSFACSFNRFAHPTVYA
jgi:hypothetical protein